MSPKFLAVDDYDGQYAPFWARTGYEATSDVEAFMHEPEDFAFVAFTGGSDVTPSYYGHKTLKSYCDSHRDKIEWTIAQWALENEIPMTGICRGSQLLNVVAGGTLVQDIPSHGGSIHMAHFVDAGDMLVTSSHHQMSVLGEGGKFLAESQESFKTEACTYDGDLRDLDYKHVRWDCNGRYDLYATEAFSYPNKRIFAVQFHPEWMSADASCALWTLKQIEELLAFIPEVEDVAGGAGATA